MLAKRDGAIALLHTWPYRTELALPGIVARLRDAGAELVTVAELGRVFAGVTGPGDPAPVTWADPPRTAA
jgi:hypothetical protein